MGVGKMMRALGVCLLALSLLTACGGTAAPTAATQGQVATQAGNQGGGTGGAPAAATAAPQTAAEAEAAQVEPTASAAVATREESAAASDGAWNRADATQIALSGNAITMTGGGATVDGSTVTITAAGAYVLSGSLADGQVVVDTADQGLVRLVLNGADISSSTSAPIYVIHAAETVIVLADGTANTVSDADAYVLKDAASDEPNAAIFSKGDLTFEGSGSLTVAGHYNDGIASKDGLVIAGGVINVTATDDGIRGKDYLVVKAGQVTVQAGGDGLKSDNEEDAAKGYIKIEAGAIDVTAGGDAITAQTDVTVLDGEITLSSGGGSRQVVDDTVSAKGIKGLASVNIAGGAFTIDSADDAVHSNKSLVVQGGAFVISTGDDGMHADETLEINGGDIRITDSYEGIESAAITLNGGVIRIVSSDDGLNVAGGQDGSGMARGTGRGGGPGGGRQPGQDVFAASGNYILKINGGYIVVDANGDGIDSNGNIEMTAGVVLVNGPTQRNNSALDYNGSFKLTGGFLIAAGSSGMAQAPDQSSTQYSVLLNLSSAVKAGSLMRVQTEAGNEILTFAPTKQYQSIAFSSPELAKGTTYEVYFGGTSTGTASDGLYEGGTYAAGSKAGTFTVSGMVTKLSSR